LRGEKSVTNITEERILEQCHALMRVNTRGEVFVRKKIFFTANFRFSYKQCFLKVLKIKKIRTVKERHDKIEAPMKVLISKCNEMIDRQIVLGRKEKEVVVLSIRATVNNESVGDNSKNKEKKLSKADD
jgi:hypothetical protein